ncbi:MAG: hypothetical protein ACQEQM_02795 [Thermoplasmatota archaeon]
MNEYFESDILNNNVEKGKNILESIESFLFPGEMVIEGTGYERNLLDKRVEKYLDDHFEEYIQEFGLIRELELEIFESRYETLLNDIDDISEFQEDIESELASMKRRLDKLESI